MSTLGFKVALTLFVVIIAVIVIPSLFGYLEHRALEKERERLKNANEVDTNYDFESRF